jgi:small subunit ribosomal protein S18
LETRTQAPTTTEAPATAPRPVSPPARQSPGGSGPRPYMGRGRPRSGFRYAPRRKVCDLCVNKIVYVDYKDVSRLRRFVSERGKIQARRKTGACARHQRALTKAIKRARHVALLPYTSLHALDQAFYVAPHRNPPGSGFGRRHPSSYESRGNQARSPGAVPSAPPPTAKQPYAVQQPTSATGESEGTRQPATAPRPATSAPSEAPSE